MAGSEKKENYEIRNFLVLSIFSTLNCMNFYEMWFSEFRMRPVEGVTAPDRERMCLKFKKYRFSEYWAKNSLIHLRVEDPLAEVNEVVIAEEQVEVFQGFCQEEGLLNIIFVSSNLQKREDEGTWPWTFIKMSMPDWKSLLSPTTTTIILHTSTLLSSPLNSFSTSNKNNINEENLKDLSSGHCVACI